MSSLVELIETMTKGIKIVEQFSAIDQTERSKDEFWPKVPEDKSVVQK